MHVHWMQLLWPGLHQPASEFERAVGIDAGAWAVPYSVTALP